MIYKKHVDALGIQLIMYQLGAGLNVHDGHDHRRSHTMPASNLLPKIYTFAYPSCPNPNLRDDQMAVMCECV